MLRGNYLITTDNWFIAPDGREYKAAWGYVEIVEDSLIGVKTNRNSTNWFAKVGNNDCHIVIAGCQIHYAIRCEQRPNNGGTVTWGTDPSTGRVFECESPPRVYIFE